MVSYDGKKFIENLHKEVSGPSRGLGDFLQEGNNMKDIDKVFPAPLEAWVVSYSLMATQLRKRSGSFRPLSRYGWFPTQRTRRSWLRLGIVPGLSRGMSRFLRGRP